MSGTKTGTVVILGAGPAGLAAGFALSRAGWTVQVVEQSQMLGGLARTEVCGDYRFDIGGHRWFTKKDELNHFLVELLGDELVLTDRISRIYFDGKFVQYPLQISNVVAHINPLTSARAVSDFVISQAAQRLSSKPIKSMEDAYVAQFGRTLYELFFRQYSEKVWGQTCAELSGDWVSQRSGGLTLLTTVREALKKRSNTTVESLVEQFMYPRYGYGRISERMAEEIERFGGSIQLGWRVVGVTHDRLGITDITVSNGSTERHIGGDAFISSIPMTELAQIMRPTADSAVLDATRVLTYRDIITVNLMLNRPSVTNDTWVYIHDPKISFARLHEPRNWSPAMAPEGKTSLVLEVFCERGDAMWERSDEELCEIVTRDLSEKLHFIEPSDVMASFAVRCRDAYPRYSLGYREAVDAVKGYLRSFRNLSIVGRGGTFRYNNTDHSIETGLYAAGNILGEVHDVDSVNEEQEYLERRTVPAKRLSPSEV